MQVESTSIGWSLGYMLNMSNMIPSDVKKITPMTDPLFAGLIFLFSALTIVTVVFIFIIIIRTCYWGCTPPATSHGLAVTIPGALHHLDTSLSATASYTRITQRYRKGLDETSFLSFNFFLKFCNSGKLIDLANSADKQSNWLVIFSPWKEWSPSVHHKAQTFSQTPAVLLWLHTCNSREFFFFFFKSKSYYLQKQLCNSNNKPHVSILQCCLKIQY